MPERDRGVSTHAIDRPVILLMGFAPAEGARLDPSGALLALLAANPPGGAEIRTQLLPPDSEAALLKAIEALDRLLPDAVIGLGKGDNPSALSVDRIAVNSDDRPDSGRAGTIETIDPAGPAAYFSTLPVHIMAERMQAGGIPAVISNAPGAYPCNRLYYALLHYVAVRGKETWFRRRPPAGLTSRIGFIRLPSSAQTSAGRGLPGHSPDLESSLTGVVLALESVIDYLATPEARTFVPSPPGD